MQDSILTEKLNIKLNNLNGIFQIISVNLATAFAGYFIKRLNASDNLVSVFNSIPAYFSIAAILLSAPIFLSCKNKKKITAISFFITRFFYLLMALVPFLDSKYRAVVFVILYGASNFPGSVANFLWQSFFADIFKPSIRARVLSVRNSLSSVAGTITTLIAGLFLYKLSNTRQELIHYYQFIFLAAFIIGIIEVITLLMHKNNPYSNYSEITTDNTKLTFGFLKEMIAHKEYLIFIICVIVFHFSWQMGWSLFLIDEVDVLHSNELWSGIISTVNSAFMVIGYIYWRKFVEKRGNSLGIALSSIGTALCPIFYAMSTKIYHVAIFTALIGFTYSGVQLILLNTLFETSPRENRTSYIVIYNLATNITLLFAPWVGLEIYKLSTLYTALLIVGGFRFLAVFLFFIRSIKIKNNKSIIKNIN